MSDETEIEMSYAFANAADMKTASSQKGSFVAMPIDFAIHSLESLQDRPNRARANVTFRTAKSLAEYLNRFGTAETVLFSNPDKREIAAILDYHGEDGSPSHCEHKAKFSAIFDPRYEAWRKINGKGMSQIDAGLFLEERAVDITTPDPASIMDMVMQFDALKKVTYRSSQRLHDGQRQFTYHEENEARGNVTLPERITLRLPVFEDQEPDVVTVRVRYRIDDGSLRFAFEIHDREQIERVAFQRCEDALITATALDFPFYQVA